MQIALNAIQHSSHAFKMDFFERFLKNIELMNRFISQTAIEHIGLITHKMVVVFS